MCEGSMECPRYKLGVAKDMCTEDGPAKSGPHSAVGWHREVTGWGWDGNQEF